MSSDADKETAQQNPANEVEDVVEQAQQEVARSQVPWYRILQRTRFLVPLYLIIFVLFSLLAWYVYFNPVLPIDIAITREFQEHNIPWLLSLMEFVSLPGNLPVMPVLVVLTAALLWLVHMRLESIYMLVLSGVSEILNLSLKVLVNRPRPNASLVEVFQAATGKSFPSGHVMSYVAYWGLVFALVFVLFKRDRWWHYALLIISAFFVVLVGPSRVYLGDHWASDVFGAYLLEGLLLGLSFWIYLSLKRRGVLDWKRSTRKGHSVQHELQHTR